MMDVQSVIVIGAGPAGLAAAYELGRLGVRPLVIEAGDRVGGLARTETYKGYRFDIGGHRFYTKEAEVQQLWERMMGDEFLQVRRLSRIYYNGRFFTYPVSVPNLVKNLGPIELFRIFGSYCKARLRPIVPEESFEAWIINRFGSRLYRAFFKTYTEKVWGIPCTELRADWAAQHIKGLSLIVAARKALFGSSDVKSLIDEFHYPRLGPGQMWERFHEQVEDWGGRVQLDTAAQAIHHEGGRVTAVSLRRGEHIETVAAEQFIVSIPISQLVQRLQPARSDRGAGGGARPSLPRLHGGDLDRQAA